MKNVSSRRGPNQSAPRKKEHADPMRSLERLGLPGFVVRRLEKGGFTSLEHVRDALSKSPDLILAVPYVGQKILDQIRRAMKNLEAATDKPVVVQTAQVKAEKPEKPKKKPKKTAEETSDLKAKDKKAKAKKKKKKDKKSDKKKGKKEKAPSKKKDDKKKKKSGKKKGGKKKSKK